MNRAQKIKAAYFQQRAADGTVRDYRDIPLIERWGGIRGLVPAAIDGATKGLGTVPTWTSYIPAQISRLGHYLRPKALGAQLKHWWDPKTNPRVSWSSGQPGGASGPDLWQQFDSDAARKAAYANWESARKLSERPRPFQWQDDPDHGPGMRTFMNLVGPLAADVTTIGQQGLAVGKDFWNAGRDMLGGGK